MGREIFEDVSSRIGDGLHGTPQYDPKGEYFFINGNNLDDGKMVFKSNTKKVSKNEYKNIKESLLIILY